MSLGSLNQSYMSRVPVATMAMKCKQQEQIDKQIADYLAAGGQIHRFELISRDVNGKPFNPINPDTLPGKTKKG